MSLLAAAFLLARLGTDRVLEPDAAFHVRAAVPDTYRTMTARTLLATGSGLAFLLSDASGLHVVAVTDTAGGLQKIVPVPAYRVVGDWLEGSPQGGYFVRKFARGAGGGLLEQILAFDDLGRAAGTREYEGGYTESLLVGSRFVGVKHWDHVESEDAKWMWGPHAGLRSIRAAALGENRLAVVDRTAGAGYILDLRTGMRAAVTFTAAVPPPRLAIKDASGSPDGTLYLLMGSGKVEDGWSVVAENIDTGVRGSFRCRLPQFEESRTRINPEGWLRPSRVAVDNGFLFLFDGAGGVARYRL